MTPPAPTHSGTQPAPKVVHLGLSVKAAKAVSLGLRAWSDGAPPELVDQADLVEAVLTEINRQMVK
jgi:hypothetical protein